MREVKGIKYKCNLSIAKNVLIPLNFCKCYHHFNLPALMFLSSLYAQQLTHYQHWYGLIQFVFCCQTTHAHTDDYNRMVLAFLLDSLQYQRYIIISATFHIIQLFTQYCYSLDKTFFKINLSIEKRNTNHASGVCMMLNDNIISILFIPSAVRTWLWL